MFCNSNNFLGTKKQSQRQNQVSDRQNRLKDKCAILKNLLEKRERGSIAQLEWRMNWGINNDGAGPGHQRTSARHCYQYVFNG